MEIKTVSEFAPLDFSEDNVVYSMRYYFLRLQQENVDEEPKSYVTFFTGSLNQIRQYEKVQKQNPSVLRIAREVVAVYCVSECGKVEFIKNNFQEVKHE